MEHITSFENRNIKNVKSLKLKKFRNETNRFFIEGKRFVYDALKSDFYIPEIFISDSFYECEANSEIIHQVHSRDIKLFICSDVIFNKLTDTENPQGILAVVEMPKIKEITCKHNGFYIILDNLTDPGNIGTIIRTADAAGADAVFISEGSTDIYNPKVLRSTMGSVFHIPVLNNVNIYDIIFQLKDIGIPVFAADINGKKSCFEMNTQKGAAILIGNEANGLSYDSISSADELIKIPMFGDAESLNASVAAGILMYMVVGKRVNKP
jgi:RNA methyltransferase, TrmH family